MTLKIDRPHCASSCLSPRHTHAADLRFGTDAAYPPYEYKLPDGRLAGLDIDIGNALCAAAKVKCVWVENSFDGMIAGLQSRKFDAINSGARRHRRAPRRDGLHARRSIPPTSGSSRRRAAACGPMPKSLAGKHVGVLQGSVQAAFAKANWAKNGVAVDEYADQNAVYADLANGRLDATLVARCGGAERFSRQAAGREFRTGGAAHRRSGDPGGRRCDRREEERCENARHARRRAKAASRRRHDRQAHAQASG